MLIVVAKRCMTVHCFLVKIDIMKTNKNSKIVQLHSSERYGDLLYIMKDNVVILSEMVTALLYVKNVI